MLIRGATFRAVVLFAVIFFLIPRPEVHGQSSPAQGESMLNLPIGRRGHKPKISLQAALRIAEDFVAEEHINVAGGWFSEARFALYGQKTKPDTEKAPCWFFHWIPESGLIDAHIDLMVCMDGKAMRLPTM